jgi:hypothetical protein
MSGVIQGNESVRAPVFYDSNNTGYYVDPSGLSNLLRVACGYDAGVNNSISCSDWFRSSGNTGWYNATHAGGMYMIDSTWVRAYNGTSLLSDNIVQGQASVRAPIFYDSNDTGYYLDPNSTSNTALRIRGGALFGPNVTWGAYLAVGGNGHISTAYASVAATNGNLHMDAASGYYMYLNYYAGSGVYFGNGASGGIFAQITSSGAFYAPIYYDYNDSNYYCDPNGTSRLNAINANSINTGAVLNATAGASGGDVGSYAFMRSYSFGSAYAIGATAAGSVLNFSAAGGANSGSGGGTWRCMGYSGAPGSGNYQDITLWLRIS